jgi:predicted phage terminase large subunit-like protein
MEMYKEYEPDAFIVEAKAAGTPLIFELRRMGIPVGEYVPSRGKDKIARVNAYRIFFLPVMFGHPKRDGQKLVIEEFAAFPTGDHDDLVDSSTQALLRLGRVVLSLLKAMSLWTIASDA